MSSLRKQLLVFGYVREGYCTKSRVEFPDDLSQLFLAWFTLTDQFDPNKLHNALRLKTNTKIQREVTSNLYSIRNICCM